MLNCHLRPLLFFVACGLSASLHLTAAHAAPPAGYSIPIIDLAGEQYRQVVVDREPGQYLGHPTTVLLEDNRTMIIVYPKGHGRGAIVMQRSADMGLSWSDRLPTPENWATSLEVPTLYRVVDSQGKKRLIMFSGLHPIRMAASEDDGANWTPLEPIGDFGGVVACASMGRLKDGSYMALFHDDGRFLRAGAPKPTKPQFVVYKIISQDGGLTWEQPQPIARHESAHLCEPGLIRSPDGKQIAVLLRENSRKLNSFVIFSDDEGQTWTEPRELPGALTGDRHTGRYAPDGRLFITFRDTTRESPTKGDWVAWVGKYEDIAAGREGQYRVRLMDNTKGGDCAYPPVEVLPDGTIITTTYGHWTEGELPYIVSVRLKLAELDERSKSSTSNTSPTDPLLKDVTADDRARLKEILASGTDRDRANSLVGKLSHAQIKSAMTPILSELEKAPAHQAAIAKLQASLKEIGGIAKTGPGGPGWLRILAGNEAMRPLDQLASVDLYDRQDPHRKDYKLNTKIEDAWLENVAGFPQLKMLDLANANIRGPGLAVVGKLTNLETLNLTLTPVTDESLAQLKNLTKLKNLLVASTKLTGEGFRELGNLQAVVNLNCHFTPVNDAGLREISRLTGLERLEIVHTHFTDAGTVHLAKLVNLRRLQIGSRDATGAAIAPLRSLPNLQELDLSDNQATLEGVQYASEIATLKVLRVSQGNSKDEGAALISKLSNLETLVLGQTGITEAGLAHLEKLTKLKTLELRQPGIKPEMLVRLKEKLPGLRIVD